MKFITWNIQWARGIDLAVDPARIARTASKLADFDVLCLQEVAVNFPTLPGSRGEDQVSDLSRALPGYSVHYGAAVDVNDGKGGRSLFGNLIFSRLPVVQVLRHLLPRPADPSVQSMQRIAVEAIIAAPWGRYESLRRIWSFMRRGNARRKSGRCVHCTRRRVATLPYRTMLTMRQRAPVRVLPRPASAILAGDFNFTQKDPEYQFTLQSFGTGNTPAFVDSWTIAHPGKPHAPTAGIFENSWTKKPICCDFVFVTEDLLPRVRSATVDALTQASDHQPVLVEFGT